MTPPDNADNDRCAHRHHDTKSHVVVDVLWVVPVAIGAAHVLRIVPEGAAAQDAVREPTPATTVPPGTDVALGSGDFLPATQ
jgi:hypothetical protein